MYIRMNTNTPSRTKQLHIRITAEEADAIKEHARSAGFSLSDFIRTCGLHGKVSPVPSINLEQWAHLAATTSNLNQLTRLCNHGAIPCELLPTITETATVLKEVRCSLIAKN